MARGQAWSSGSMVTQQLQSSMLHTLLRNGTTQRPPMLRSTTMTRRSLATRVASIERAPGTTEQGATVVSIYSETKQDSAGLTPLLQRATQPADHAYADKGHRALCPLSGRVREGRSMSHDYAILESSAVSC